MTDKLPGDLLDDASGDDRTDHALKARFDSFAEADALHWLLDGAAPPQAAPQDSPRVMEARGEKSLLRRVVPVAPTAQDDTVTAIAGDVARGFTEVPMQVAGGIRDAANSLLDFSKWAGSYLPSWGTASTRDQLVKDFELFHVPEAKTTTGSVVRNITQFVGPFHVR